MNRPLLILALTLGALLPARAQVAVENTIHPVNQYLENRSEVHPAAWWSALGAELTRMLEHPDGTPDPVALQNVIYFATHQGDKIDLDPAAPILLDVYMTHDDEQIRTMALVALHAIGEPVTMRKLAEVRKQEPSEKLRKLTLVALADYYEN